jgi:hypothetical protein
MESVTRNQVFSGRLVLEEVMRSFAIVGHVFSFMVKSVAENGMVAEI